MSNSLHSFANVSSAGKTLHFMYFDTVCGETSIAFAISFCVKVAPRILSRKRSCIKSNFINHLTNFFSKIIAYYTIILLTIVYYTIYNRRNKGGLKK